ncbi:hypothetical protein [uncultured Ruminococcus sp.]|uniref:hypothetical protein n=1 Tax=uncultured Ruminococcus sp. TaxID=165186 RepID=UPI0025FD5DA3|nr:hypothetical protein [uncultured Ruminococcus sp.]
MNKRKIMKVIDFIDEDIIKEAEIRSAPLSDTEKDNDIIVSGVERYRGAIWRRLAAAVSVVLLIAGAGAGGALMLKKRPPLIDENAETTTEDTTEVRYAEVTQNKNENNTAEKTEATTAKTSEGKQKETKESKNTTTAEKDKKSAVRDHCYPEDSTAAPREENNEPEERENVTTAANTTQLPVLRTTVTKTQTTTKAATVTTDIEKTPPPKIVTTEPVTERPTPEHDPGYIPYLTWNPEDTSWLMNTLSSLAYTPWSYDVTVGGRPPEAYIRNGADGNEYTLCFSERWVRRNGCEQAYMPDEIYNYYVENGSRFPNIICD